MADETQTPQMTEQDTALEADPASYDKTAALSDAAEAGGETPAEDPSTAAGTQTDVVPAADTTSTPTASDDSTTSTSPTPQSEASPADPTVAQTGPDAWPAQGETTGQDDVAVLPGDDAVGHAPAAKTADHAEDAVAPDAGAQDTAATDAGGGDVERVPGEGATHAGTDTPEYLAQNPADPCTGKPLDTGSQADGAGIQDAGKDDCAAAGEDADMGLDRQTKQDLYSLVEDKMMALLDDVRGLIG